MTKEEFASKVDWEGGPAEAIMGYGLGVGDLPEDAPAEVVEAVWVLEKARDALRTIEEYIDSATTYGA